MPSHRLFLVADRETGRIECGFPRRISAETYINGENLRAWMHVVEIQVFDEYDDAKAFAEYQRKQKALAKLSPEDRKALGL